MKLSDKWGKWFNPFEDKKPRGYKDKKKKEICKGAKSETSEHDRLCPHIEKEAEEEIIEYFEERHRMNRTLLRVPIMKKKNHV